MKKEIKNEVRRMIEDANYSLKGHFSASLIYSYTHLGLGLLSAILSFVAVTIILSDPNKLNCVALLSLISGVLVTLSTFLEPEKKHKEHLKAGNMYLSLRNDVRIFNNIKLDDMSDEDAVKVIEELNNRRNKLNSDLLQIPHWAFLLARKNIEDGQLQYEVDKNK